MDIKREIPVYEIFYEAKTERVYLKTSGKSIIKEVPTEKGVKDIIKRIKQILKNKRISYEKSFFRIFNHSRIYNLLAYGSDRTDQLEKRKFDITEWELYPFRLIYDYFYTNKNKEFILVDGTLFKNSLIKNSKEFFDRGGIRKDVYAGIPDKWVLNYYNKILKKYKYLEKQKNSKYYKFYIQLKKVKTEFPKKERGLQPEFMLSEKIAMKKHELMREDVTFAYRHDSGLGINYILKDAIRKRVPSKIAALAVYKELVPILPRITKGGYDETGLYGFKRKRLDHLVALFLLIPK